MKAIKAPSRNTMLLRAVVNIIFGILLLALPGLTLWILAIAFAVNLLIIGIFMIFEPALDSEVKHAWLSVLVGFLSIGTGVYLLARPLASIAVLTIVFALWALMFGAIDLALGFKLTEMKKSQSWLFYIAGILSIIFAIFLLFNPIEGSVAVVWAIGVYSLAIGIITGYNALFHSQRPSKSTPKRKSTKKKGKK